MSRRIHLIVGAPLFIAMLAPVRSLAAQSPKPGDQVPDFVFTDFRGKQHRLSDYSGRYVLLDFWATWCGPCVKEVPTLRKAEELYQTRGLEILGLNSDEKIEKARKFLEDNPVSWTQSVPNTTKKIVDGELKVKWYPTMILIDPHRRIVFVSGNGKSVLRGKNFSRSWTRFCGPQPSPDLEAWQSALGRTRLQEKLVPSYSATASGSRPRVRRQRCGRP